MRHPLDQYSCFSTYACTNSTVGFIIEPYSCVCNGCFQDYHKYCRSDNKNDYIPRWQKLKIKCRLIEKHFHVL